MEHTETGRKRFSMKEGLCVLSMMVICLLWTFFQQPYAQEQRTGKVDWVEGYISARGQGTATPSGNRVKDQMRAIRAATVLAQRALLEATKGLKIDSKTKVENRMLKEDIIHSRVEGLIRGAEIIKQEVLWDGDTPVASVEMRICISNEGRGCKASESLISVLDIGQKDEPANAPKQRLDDISAKQKTPIPKIQNVTYDPGKSVTGIIISLQGLPYERVTLPVVITIGEGNRPFTVYSVKSVDPPMIRTYGVVRYAESVEQARQHPHLGDNPIIIPVSQVTSENMIIIAFDAARIIRETTRHGNDYLKQAKVVISAK